MSLSAAVISAPDVKLQSKRGKMEVDITEPVLRKSSLKDIYTNVLYRIRYWKDEKNTEVTIFLSICINDGNDLLLLGANVAGPMWPASDWVSFAVFHFKLAPGVGHLTGNRAEEHRGHTAPRRRSPFMMVIQYSGFAERLAFRDTNTTARIRTTNSLVTGTTWYLVGCSVTGGTKDGENLTAYFKVNIHSCSAVMKGSRRLADRGAIKVTFPEAAA